MKTKITIIIGLIAVGIFSLVIATSSKDSHPHLKLSEFSQKYLNNNSQLTEVSNSMESGRFMTIYGSVKEGSIQKMGTAANFIIVDGTKEMSVFFTGETLLPDTFKDGAEAALDGHYDVRSKKFIAKKAMAKCASKYEAAGKSLRMGHPQGLPKGIKKEL